MARRLLATLVGIGLLTGAASATQAASIAFFDNPAFTDPPEESARLATSLSNRGHTLTTFSGITAADFTAATAGNTGTR